LPARSHYSTANFEEHSGEENEEQPDGLGPDSEGNAFSGKDSMLPPSMAPMQGKNMWKSNDSQYCPPSRAKPVSSYSLHERAAFSSDKDDTNN